MAVGDPHESEPGSTLGDEGDGRILLVEDDVSAWAAGAYFEAFGFTVRTARRASEALELARAWPPDLVVVDILLDGARTGADVALLLRAERPSLPIIVLTGISDAELEAYEERLEGFPVLRKPLRLLELAEEVRRSMFERRSERRASP